jgi:hypothetical protein
VTAALLLILSVMLLLALVLGPSDTSGARPLLSGYNFVIALFVVYFAFPGWLYLANDHQYVWAEAYDDSTTVNETLLLVIAALGAFVLGYRMTDIRRRASTEQPKDATMTATTARSMRGAVYVIIAVGLGFKALAIKGSGGIDSSILRLSGYARESLDLVDVQGWVLGMRALGGFADLGATWLLVEAIRTRRGTCSSLLIFCAVIGSSYVVSGKRLTLIVPIAAVVLAISYFRRKITVKSAPLALFAVFVAGMGSLLFRILAPARIGGYNIDLATTHYAHGSLLRFYAYSLEFSTLEMSSVAISAGRSIRDSFGGAEQAFITSNLSPFLYGVPRAVFPWKPTGFYDLSYGVSGVLSGQSYSSTHVGYASTLVGTSQILAGPAGVILAFFAFGVVTRLIDRRLRQEAWTATGVIAYAAILNIVFHFFRQGTLGWTFIVAVVLQYGFLLGLLVLILIERNARERDSRTPLPARVKALV